MQQLFEIIKDYGGYAGAASVLGLAVLSLLYFAQAREVRRLREWAGRAPERAAEMEQRVVEAARRPSPAVQRQPVAPGQPQTAAAQAAARPAPANGQAGGVPAGAVASGAAAAGAVQAAAATGAAATTPGSPTTPGAAGATPGQPATGAPAGDGDGDGERTAATAGDTAEAPALSAAAAGTLTPTDGTPPTTPAPGAPAAGAIPPSPGDTPAPVPPRTAAARPRPSTPSPRPAAPLRSSSAAPRSRPATAAPQRSRRLPVVLIVAAVGVVLVGVALALVLGGGGGNQTASSGAQTNAVVPAAGSETTPKTATNAAERPRADTTVAVLNGTTISGLAARTAEKLKSSGYSLGTVADAPEQNRSATLVQYGEGARREALAVAKIIDVGADAVSPLDVNTRTVAGDNARVVVTVGADQNQQSGQG